MPDAESDAPRWRARRRKMAAGYFDGPTAEKDALLAQHQFAPKYPVVCSCGFSAGFAMDSETPWIHHVALVLREAGLTEPEDEVADLLVTRVIPPGVGS